MKKISKIFHIEKIHKEEKENNQNNGIFFWENKIRKESSNKTDSYNNNKTKRVKNKCRKNLRNSNDSPKSTSMSYCRNKRTVIKEGNEIIKKNSLLYRKNISKIQKTIIVNSNTKKKSRKKCIIIKKRIEETIQIKKELPEQEMNKEKNDYLINYDINKNYEKELYLKNRKYQLKKNDYMKKYEFFSSTNRGTVIDWIQNCCKSICISKHTFYLCIEIFDSFLSITKKKIDFDTIQLVALGCLRVAYKFEDLQLFNINCFCKLANNKYAKDLIINQENDIIISLKFELNIPTLLTWINFHTSVWDSLMDYLIEYDFDYPKFRNDNNFGDKLLMKIYFICDIICFDYYFTFLDYKYLSLACLILIIGQAKNIFNQETFENLLEYSNNFFLINNFMTNILKILNKYLFLDNFEYINDYLSYARQFMKINFDNNNILNNHIEKYNCFKIQDIKRNYQTYYKNNESIIKEIESFNLQEKKQ